MSENLPTGKPLPYVLAMVFCDSIYVDPSTGKKTLLGLFSAVFSRQYPVRLPQLVLYAALTDGRGPTPIQIKLVDANEEREPIFQTESSVDFTDPRLVAECVIGMRNIEFPKSGEYRLQLLACGSLLMERRIVIASPPEQPNA